MRAMIFCLAGALLVSGCSGTGGLPSFMTGAKSVPITESARPPSRSLNAAVDPVERNCLADAIYHEAKNTGPIGLQAVAHVVMNRVEDREFPNTVCAVVSHGESRGRCQFAYRCDGLAEIYSDRPAHRRALALADRFLSNPPADITKGSRFFHASWARPNAFFKSRPFVGKYGGNTFYL